MSETADHDSKTEEPTEKKLSDARDKGSVPVARELLTFGSLGAILIGLRFLHDQSGPGLAAFLGLRLETSGVVRFDSIEDVKIVIAQHLVPPALALLPVLAIMSAGSVLASLAQNVPQLAAERIRPTWTRVSPAAGWKRLFGAQAGVDFLRSMLKLAAVIAVAAVILKRQLATVATAMESDPTGLLSLTASLCLQLLATLCLFSAILAVADLAWSRFKWRHDLRMSRQEIKDEYKQQEGDPHLKARIRSIGRQRAGRRMMKKLPTATMVVTNPTHYAVALRYVREEGGVPIVVAKGVDHLALRIRELAAGHDIPVVEDKPLARALYEKVGLDQAIPAELYRAVAEIIHYLQIRKTYGRAGAASPGQASPRRT